MIALKCLIKRNCKLFFKDKAMFFTALITPIILLVLYITFLGNIYKSSFVSVFPSEIGLTEKLVNGYVSAQLISSLLAVCCVTVAFCSNMLMVSDKVNGVVNDFCVTPLKKSVLSFGYYISTAISTMLVCFFAFIVGMIYIAFTGWFFSFFDIALIFLDVFLLVMFGTALSSIINFFLSTQGQISAVGTVVSSGYGFLCGAYMPISNFSEQLRKIIMFLPGTYGTSLLRNHSMRGVFSEMINAGINIKTVEILKDTVDCNLYFFGHKISLGIMYLVLILTIVFLISVYVIINKRRKHS